MGDLVDIVEIFSSVQGEGAFVGYRQVFVRFASCNLRCTYCDTPESRNSTPAGKIEKTAGRRDFFSVTNPLEITQVANYINALLTSPHHSVSLTGGEPLMHAHIIGELAPAISIPIYLETNGTLPEKLALVLPHLDIISMDIKLPSTCGEVYWAEHKKFLSIAVEKKVFVKIVVAQNTTAQEFTEAVNLISSVSRNIPLIIQPVTPVGGLTSASAEAILLLQEQALHILTDVRIIPQTHKFMGQL